jgi:hypothetical protein
MPNTFKVELSLGDLFEVHKLLASNCESNGYSIGVATDKLKEGVEPASYYAEYVNQARAAIGLYERFAGGPYNGPVVAKLQAYDEARLAFVPAPEEPDDE